jgi:hypothetical protein
VLGSVNIFDIGGDKLKALFGADIRAVIRHDNARAREFLFCICKCGSVEVD